MLKADNFFKYLMLWLYPPKCMICSEIIPLVQAASRCPSCAKDMDIIKELFCCKPIDTVYFDKSVALLDYQGDLIKSIRRMKYNRRKDYAQEFGIYMGEKFRIYFTEHIDGVVPVPMHKERQKKRGYNQCEIMAEAFCAYTKIPIYSDLLIRTKNTKAQYKLDRSQRKENIADAFSINRELDIAGKTILLIDDIYTTGSTLNECARILKMSNASKVFTYALSLTPYRDHKYR